MTTYVFGDVQGCFDSLQALLKKIRVRSSDTLWFVGDLVNRGPRSKAMAKWILDESDRIELVLGNHDLHFLARYRDLVPRKNKDTLDALLESNTAGAFAQFLRHQPFILQSESDVMVHGGLDPWWSPKKAFKLGRKASKVLQGPRWETALVRETDDEEVSDAISWFTRVRMVNTEEFTPEEYFKGPPEENRSKLLAPWYQELNKDWRSYHLYFGHWSALGYRSHKRWTALDSGCVWGRKLTCVEQESGQVYQIDAVE